MTLDLIEELVIGEKSVRVYLAFANMNASANNLKILYKSLHQVTFLL